MLLYYYPPIGGIGSARTLRLAKNLPELGWEPLVLTVSERTLAAVPCDVSSGDLPGVRVFRTRNPDLAFRAKRLAGLDISTNVEAVRAMESMPGQRRAGAAARASDLLGIPDRFIDWAPFARRAAMDICRMYSPRLIFTSSPPESCHLVAASLRSSTGLPWLADMRDPWVHKFNMPRSDIPGKITAWLEHRTLPKADAITVVSDSIAADIQERLGLDAKTIPNSYDEDAFASASPVVEDCFNLLYAGTLYYPDQDPRPVFRALAGMRRSGRDISRLTVSFAGKDISVAQSLARNEGVEDRVEMLGLLTHEEAMAREKGAGALLYLQVVAESGSDIVSKGPTGKLIEYFGAGRPVLALQPLPGPVDDLIHETGAGVVARDATGVRAVLERWLDEFESTGKVAFQAPAGLRRYGSKATAEAMASLFDDVAAGGRGC